MHAFRAAVSVHRTDLLELDVRATRDGVAVVAHDPTLDRCTDGIGELKALSFDELSRLDAGFRFTKDSGATFPLRGQGVKIPRFEEVLEAFPGQHINVELKAADAVAPFIEIVKRTGVIDRLCIGSEHDAIAAQLVDALPDGCFFFPSDALVAFVGGFKSGALVDDARFTVLDMPYRFMDMVLFDRALADEAARRGKWINVWTVDDPEDMRNAISQGVSGIMTDRPDVLRTVLDSI